MRAVKTKRYVKNKETAVISELSNTHEADQKSSTNRCFPDRSVWEHVRRRTPPPLNAEQASCAGSSFDFLWRLLTDICPAGVFSFHSHSTLKSRYTALCPDHPIYTFPHSISPYC